MTDEQKKSLVGKYVCYDAIDGGACWGRIEEVVKVNTMSGEVDAVILSDQYVRYVRSKDLKTFRKFYPNTDASLSPSVGEVDEKGKRKDSSELFLETRKIKGNRVLQLRSINVEKDIVDVSDMLGKVDTDILFQAFLDGRGKGENGRSALEIGMLHLMGDEAMRKLGKEELGKRV